MSGPKIGSESESGGSGGGPTTPAQSGPNDLFGATGSGPTGGSTPPDDEFDTSSGGKKWAIGRLVLLVLAPVLCVGGLYGVGAMMKGAFFGPSKAAVATAPAPAEAEPEVAQGDPAVPAPDEPAPAEAAEVLLSCTYTANAAVTCSGTLPQPIDEVVEWLPGDQQLPAPAPAKARLRVKVTDGREYVTADVVEIAEGAEGAFSEVKFILASNAP